jgi:hypothetical protein
MPRQDRIFEPGQNAAAKDGSESGGGDDLPSFGWSNHILEFSSKRQIKLKRDGVSENLHHIVRMERQLPDPEIHREVQV